MPMSAQKMNELKQAINELMQYRNGFGDPQKMKWPPYEVSKPFGSLAEYGSDRYSFSRPAVKGGRVTLEQGQKTLNIVNDVILDELWFGGIRAEAGLPIPKQLSDPTIISQVESLRRDYTFSGETAATIAARKAAGDSNIPEHEELQSCKAACSGLCVGSCIGMCNGCLDTCTATCGTGCANGLMVSAK